MITERMKSEQPTHILIYHGCEVTPVNSSVPIRCRRMCRSKILTHPTVDYPVAIIEYGGQKMSVKVRMTSQGTFDKSFDRTNARFTYTATNHH